MSLDPEWSLPEPLMEARVALMFSPSEMTQAEKRLAVAISRAVNPSGLPQDGDDDDADDPRRRCAYAHCPTSEVLPARAPRNQRYCGKLCAAAARRQGVPMREPREGALKGGRQVQPVV
jgi:hypothetical protein